MNPERDAIAETAARLVAEGQSASLESALHRLEAPAGIAPAARRHLHAMDLRRLGEDGMTAARRDMLESALAVMETIDLLEARVADSGIPYRGVRLVGAAAEGRPDLREAVHLRIHGDRSPAAWLEELSVLEPLDERRFTSETRYGRLSGFELNIDGTAVRAHRCPVDQVPLEDRHLFTGVGIPVATLAMVRRLADDTPRS